jgi:hypothetical protein
MKDGLPEINCPYSSTGNASQEPGYDRFATRAWGFRDTCAVEYAAAMMGIIST